MNKSFYKIVFPVFIFIIFFVYDANAQMFWNQACNFTGGTDSSHVSVRDDATLDITGSFTMEAWVNPSNVASPSFQIIMQKRNTGANGYTLYLSNGKIAIRTGSSTRLTGSAVIPNNAWTHIAGTYNSATNTFTTYVNGFFDTSSVVAGAAPVANTDSLWIGKGSNSPFAGQLDEVRIWNRVLSLTELDKFMHTSLGSNTGPYSGLVLSLTFQDNDANGVDFLVSDLSETGNDGINRGVTAFDMSNRPLQTIQMNDCIELDGSADYLTGPDNAYVSPTTQLTLSAWIYMRSYANSIIIHKGGASGGASTNYRLSVVGRKLSAGINGNFNFLTNDTLPLHRWTYVTFTYLASLGAYQFHINGILVKQGTNSLGNITDGTDSLYIGGSASLINFDGYIDEVRIIPDVKFTETINQFMFKSIDLSNGGTGNYAIYNFDGYAHNNGGNVIPILRFNGDGSEFAHCGSVNDQPQSPMNRSDNLNFQSGFQQKYSGKRIPASGNSGSVTDSLNILLNESISDLNVFVTLNHNEEHELEISLIGPGGTVVQLYNNNRVITNADHVTTIFDDNADSSIVNFRYISFSPSIKPYQNINSVFGGSNSQGMWRLVIRDIASSSVSDTGILYGWGIQFNNNTTKPYLLNANALIQGFYNPASNTMIRDTMRFYLRNVEFPYGIYDSVKSYLTNSGFSQINFSNVASGNGYYLQLKHRNSIETWNSEAVYYDPLTFQSEYNFKSSNLKAYGGNELLVDLFPLSFAIISGDVDQDGIVDASDLSTVENDASISLSGYVKSDVTGDDYVDGSDISLVENNLSLEKAVPPGALAPVNSDSEENTEVNNTYSDPGINTSLNNGNSSLIKYKRADSEK
ncbi:MAG: proprotein convertase P-domain-containing protein [Ignavibacteria bacterium]|nr:proprotein convertase P-domain-containing protein [Ignavibacteria bacterium]